MTTCQVPITVRLSGDPRRIAEDELSASVERAVTQQLARTRRELLARGLDGRHVAVVMGGPASTPAERIESDRLGAAGYELTSFEDGGRTRVPVSKIDPVVESAQRALSLIHRQLERGFFDWLVTKAEAREVLRILATLHGEVLMHTVRAMKLTGDWKTLGDALGDDFPDDLFTIEERLDPQIGELSAGDQIQVQVLSRRGEVDHEFSGDHLVTRFGVTLRGVARPVQLTTLTPQQSADAIATAYFDALLFTEPHVTVAVLARGSQHPHAGRVSNPYAFASRVSFADTARGQQASRTRVYLDYVRALSAEDPLVARALEHYLRWVEVNAGRPEFFEREPHDLWGWALKQATAPPRQTPIAPFLAFMRTMSDQAAHAPPKAKAHMQAALGRFLDWVDRHREDPALASFEPWQIWTQAWMGAFEEEMRRMRADVRQRFKDEAEARAERRDWDAIFKKQEEAFALVNKRILPMRGPSIAEDPDEGVGYLIMPSPEERQLRNLIAEGYLNDVISRSGDLGFTRTTALEDLVAWLDHNPDLAQALELSVIHPYVEHYAVEVDVSAWETAIEVGIGFIPIVGQVVAGGEALTGRSFVSWRKLSTLERGVLAAAVLLPAAARLGRVGYAAVATSRMAPAYRMSAIEARTFFRATARIAPGTAGNQLLARAAEDVRAGRPIADSARVKALEGLTRDMGVTDRAAANALESRAAGSSPLAAATDQELEALFREEGWATPKATGGQRPRIAGVRVPTRPRNVLDAADIARLAGESEADAVERVTRVIGRRIDETPLREAWEAARRRVLGDTPIGSVTREQMLGARGRAGFYDRVRDEFWAEVRRRPDASRWLEANNFELGGAPAPLLRVNRAGIAVEDTRVSLDHILEKAQGENWRRAIDADNLRFEFQSPNANREIVQARFRMRSGTPPAALPGSGPPPSPGGDQ